MGGSRLLSFSCGYVLVACRGKAAVALDVRRATGSGGRPGARGSRKVHVLALGALGNGPGPLGKRQLAVLANVNKDDVAGTPAVLEQLLGKRVLDEGLDGATQRARTIDRVGT